MTGKQALPHRGTRDLMEETHNMSLVTVHSDLRSTRGAEGAQGREGRVHPTGKVCGYTHGGGDV